MTNSYIHIVLKTLLLQCFAIAAMAQSETTKIAVLGCHQQDKPAPSLDFFADVLKPQFAVWVGDNVYADTESDPQHIQQQLDKLAAKAGFQNLRNASTFYVTWDDHDYGLNNAGKDYKFREQSKHIHRKFWKLENEIPAGRDGVYYAGIETLPNGKTIQFLMVDGRYNRDNPRNKDADALGENQWKWLEQELRKPADIRFLVSGYQVLLEKPTRWEAWIKVGKSRKRLFELLHATNANNVFFITGDQHTAEVLRSAKKLRYNTYEIMASGINQTERPGLAVNRVAGPDKTLHSSPLIEIHWTEQPYLRVLNHNAENGSVTMEYKIVLSGIGATK